ncbi:MAG: PepSY domain-containing protein [Devosia sp.]|nr:PepSY domain-containing protein [Devosia sp.]
MKTHLIALALIAPLFAGQALASEKCAVPVGSVQSKEALQQKLEAEGWQVRRIKIEGGCYEVYAVKADGTRMESEFNSATLDHQGDEAGEDGEDGENGESNEN